MNKEPKVMHAIPFEREKYFRKQIKLKNREIFYFQDSQIFFKDTLCSPGTLNKR